MSNNADLPKAYQNGATANSNYSPPQQSNPKRQKTNDIHRNNRKKPDFGKPETELRQAFDAEATLLTWSILDNFSLEKKLYELHQTDTKEAIKKTTTLTTRFLH